jgi:hypothetical protein
MPCIIPRNVRPHYKTFLPAWADNSNSTGDNPDGALHAMDVYTSAVNVAIPPPGT